jgi:hypothetical protein
MAERSERFYARYPEHRDSIRRLIARTEERPIELPSGDPLHPARVRQLGLLLGMSDGYERLHYLLELDPASPAFLHDVEQATSFARNPIYAILHEACWANGGRTAWSAQRVMAEQREGWPEDLLTGEHIYPWVFESPSMSPLREAAELLAQRDWPELYDPECLRANEVPAAAVVYAEDVYVERAFSEQTAAEVPGLRLWLTNEYDHDGLRVEATRVLGRLLDLARGRI